MIETLLDHIKNREEQQAIALVKNNPTLLDATDTNGSSGLMLLAYAGFTEAFDQAIELKKTFEFHEAIVCGKQQLVREQLMQPSKGLVNTYSPDGFTPLSLAAFFNRTEIAKLLLDHGADPNLAATNPSKVNALHSAVAKENYELVKLLIEKGAALDAVQTQKVTALHSAVHRGNLQLTQLLVENGATVSVQMENGDTPIAIAQREGNKEIATFLKAKQP
ncbi:ankyrin repeat domain-containing protein [Maribacter sp. 2-571]|uniref:ankyrin repeat domain-containing protein n=1 Tax=Maribacter sp. 2-571 TaxID=3417569 RepID=UPI003D33A36A